MRSSSPKIAVAALVSALFLGAPIAFAKDHNAWEVKGRLVAKDGSKSRDISGIACTGESFPLNCLVIDDNMQDAQFVTVEDGKLHAGDTAHLIDNAFKGKPLELDGEGVAYAQGAFYVIGSHGYPRDKKMKLDPEADADKIKARIAASSQVVRIRLKPNAHSPLTENDIQDVTASSGLRTVIAENPVLDRFLDRRLENNGITIEGVAVLGNRLFAGFREPSLEDGRAPVLSVALDNLFGSGSALPDMKLLPLGEGLGIRDLAAFEGGMLVLAGPAGEAPGPYKVYWWNGRDDKVDFLADITEATQAGKDLKPEAILPLDVGPSGVRVLILFDGGEEGSPLPVVIPNH